MRPPSVLPALAAALALIAVPALAAPEPNIADKALDTASDVVEKPLKDLNLMQDKIPPELLAIMERPYDLGSMKTCQQYSAAVARLNSALGPDVDSAEAQAKKSNGETATEYAIQGARSAIGDLLPGSGIIRKVSGAEKAQRRAQAAVLAGSLRRAFIKGTARAKGCKI